MTPIEEVTDHNEKKPRVRQRPRRTEEFIEAKKKVKEKKVGVSKRYTHRNKVDLDQMNFSLRVDEIEMPLEQAIARIFDPSIRRDQATHIGKEDDEGSIEYKLKLVDTSQERLLHLTTQMRFRLQEGAGEAQYRVGFDDDGSPIGISREELQTSLCSLCYIAESLKAEIKISKVLCVRDHRVLFVVVNLKTREKIKNELKVMLFGAPGCGKSTLLGVLLSDRLDDGNGSARMKILNNVNEIKTGVTSTLTYISAGFDYQGQIIHDKDAHHNWETSIDNCCKLVSFIDCGGQLKKELRAFLTANPELCLLVLSPMQQKETVEELLVQVIKLSSTFVVLVTHIDMASNQKTQELIRTVRDLCFANKGFIPMIVRDKDDAVLFSKNIREPIVPIFLVSNTQGSGVELFREFLLTLPSNQGEDSYEAGEFVTAQKIRLEPKERGETKLILNGFVSSGRFQSKQKAWLGPLADSRFCRIFINEIECFKIKVRMTVGGQSCSLRFSPLEKNEQGDVFDQVHKGTMVIGSANPPRLTRSFIASLEVISKSHTILFSNQYEPVLFSDSFDQVCHMEPCIPSPPSTPAVSAAPSLLLPDLDSIPIPRLERVLSKSKDISSTRNPDIKRERSMSYYSPIEKASPKPTWKLKKNEKNLLRFTFKVRPEYLRKNHRFQIHDDKLRAIGTAIELFYEN